MWPNKFMCVHRANNLPKKKDRLSLGHPEEWTNSKRAKCTNLKSPLISK